MGRVTIIYLVQYLGQINARVPSQRKEGIMSKYRQGSITEVADELTMCRYGNAPYAEIPVGCLIFTSDKEATAALSWLRASKKQTPRKIRIISLQNNPAYYQYGLTTCVLDWDKTGYLLAHAIINDIPIPRTGKGFIRVQAMVMPRDTMRE